MYLLCGDLQNTSNGMANKRGDAQRGFLFINIPSSWQPHILEQVKKLDLPLPCHHTISFYSTKSFIKKSWDMMVPAA